MPALRLFLLLLLLAACGSGSADPAAPEPGPAVPVSAGPGSAATSLSAVSGRVLDARGRPVAGVLVTATGPAPVPDLAVVTDAEGRYAWPTALGPGTWQLRAQTPDGPAVAQVALAAGQGGTTTDLQVPPP